MRRRGFTIIELIIVITIMGILMVLAVVNLRGTQANARDATRKGDADAISLNLESFYTSGYTASTALGRYPSTAMIGQETTYLPNIDTKSLLAPGVALGMSNTVGTPDSSLVAATCSSTCTQTTAGVTPQPTINTFVYQPIQAGGALCTSDTAQECRKFNLYYALEVAAISSNCPSPGYICMVTSKNQ